MEKNCIDKNTMVMVQKIFDLNKQTPKKDHEIRIVIKLTMNMA